MRAVVARPAFGLLMMAVPQATAARPYTVVSCDSAGLFGYSSAAWAPFGNAGSAYEACPTGGGSPPASATVSSARPTRGSTTRATRSGHHREPRSHRCGGRDEWHATTALGNVGPSDPERRVDHGPAARAVLRLKRLRQPRLATELRSPRGHNGGRTTRVSAAQRNVSPEQRSTPRLVEVTVDDPIPPSISLDGPLASGGWVSGRVGRAARISQRHGQCRGSEH